MQIRLTLLTIIAAGAVNSAIAQDRIYTKSGGMYEVKIKEVGTRAVVYKKWSNLEGPDFVMPKNEVDRIKFQNGDEEQFSMQGRLKATKTPRSSNTEYGKNIIALSPIHMTNVSPIGFGLSYERVIDKNYLVSFYLPIVYSFKNENSNNYYGGYYPYKDERKMAWFYPGAKIYPTGSDGVVRYGVGPSLAFGTGDRTYTTSYFDPQTQTTQYADVSENIFVMGILVNNSLNINPTPRLHLGLELGLGIPYYTNENDHPQGNYYNTFNDEPLVQFNFNIGYRF
ncbi:MAG TPA: hypothetical protein PL009_15090 [Flavipsychrobacter sp.]|nr:hypothetical protein [Flavipsychrobacter sp.]